MPKFLDAPSWYDSDGELREITGYYAIGVNYGTFRIPALSKASTFNYGSTVYVSSTPPGNGQVCVSSTGNLTMTSGGAAGNVLIKAANGAPTWETPSNLLFVTANVSYNGENAGDIGLIIRTTSSSISTQSALLSAIQACGIHSSYGSSNYYRLPATGIFNAHPEVTQTSPLFYPSPVSYVEYTVPSSGSAYLSVYSLTKRQISTSSTYVIDTGAFQVAVNNVESSLIGKVLI